MTNCCICNGIIEREDAPVLGMGGAGYARLLCDRCDGLLATATRGTDFSDIEAAMDELGKKLAASEVDTVTYRVMNELMVEAAGRAKAIKDGNYDFSLDENPSDDEGFDEIPEELRETEEDIAKDKADEEKMKKFDKFYNYVVIGACIAFAGFLIWKIIDAFFL